MGFIACETFAACPTGNGPCPLPLQHGVAILLPANDEFVLYKTVFFIVGMVAERLSLVLIGRRKTPDHEHNSHIVAGRHQ